MKYRSFALLVPLSVLFLLSFPSCEPLSTEDPPKDYDQWATVNAAASPDTVQSDQPFITQINFGNVCGGTFRRLQKYYSSDTSGVDSGIVRISIGPLLHVNPDAQCTSAPGAQTMSDTILFGAPGRYIISVFGYNGVRRRDVIALGAHAQIPQFALRATFKDSQGFEIPGQTATLAFPDKGLSMTITADSAGVWDTTFVESGTKLRYTIDGAAFEAAKGVPSNSILWIQ